MEIVTAQVAEVPLSMLTSLHDSADTCGTADNAIDAVWLAPLAAAVITAVPFTLIALAGAVKPALFDPAGTVTLAGTTRLAELLVRLTARPPAGAGPLSVTVQETLPAPTTVAGLQDRADTCRGANNEIDEVWFVPLAAAVTTAVRSAFTALTGAVRPALFDPAGTVTLAGTTRLAELLARLTARPPAAAGPLSITVQDTLPEPTTVAGLQDRADT
jgi:hypothetical protein